MDKRTIFVPDDFYCPITGVLMVDPVSDPEGNSYEKLAIREWLRRKKISPMTRSPLIETDLTPNIGLRKSIESIRDKLSEEQLQVKGRISEEELKPFSDSLQGIQLATYYNDNKLLVKVVMPEVDARAPVDIALCIDVSGSMAFEATLKGGSGETIRNGISVLSLTISAAKAIMSALNEHDNISIITYTDKAEVIVENMACSVDNMIVIFAQLDQLRPLNTTNIWDGIHQSMDTLRKTSPPCRTKSIFLLTDGVPNQVPPRGHEYMIETYMRKHNFHCPITCFGFGYTLDSELLDSISKVTGGDGYSFIPDSGLLGNVFIHGISNLLTTASIHVKLSVRLLRDVRFTDRSQSKDIMVSSLKYGQDKNFIFDIEGDDDYNDFAEATLHVNDVTVISGDVSVADLNYYNEQVYRRKGIQLMNECLLLQKFNEPEQVKHLLNSFISELRGDLALQASQFIQDMTIDFEGQVREALNMTSLGQKEDWYNRWGKHYLRSLMGAYSHELCNNFKDKGISHFGGELFQTQRDAISDIFDSLPPPKQDVIQPTYDISNRLRSPPLMANYYPPPINMSLYNNIGGPCCAHGSIIMTATFGYKPVQDLVKGDAIMTVDEGPNYIPSQIECVIRTTCPDQKARLVQVGDLKVTPYHPIKDHSDNKWVFPITIGESSMMECPFIYSFVTKNRKSVIMNDYIFATWDHGLQGEIIGHDYFGSNQVIKDMKRFSTYDMGYVHLNYGMVKRRYGRIYGINDDMLYANL